MQEAKRFPGRTTQSRYYQYLGHRQSGCHRRAIKNRVHPKLGKIKERLTDC